MQLLLLLLIISNITISCAPEVKQERPRTDSQRGEEPIDLRADVYAFEDMNFSESSAALLNLSAGNYQYSLLSAPAWLSINSSTGQLTGVATDRPENGYTSIIIRAKNLDNNSIVEKELSMGINGDPLRQYAWHLKNSGQKTFARTAAMEGFDINVFPVYAQDITGENIRIAISDSGVEINHGDLFQNMLTGEHRDYSLEDAPYLGSPVTSSGHGTAVTGIIAARGWNNIGVTGVAPFAKIAGFQFLESPQTEELLIHQASGDFDIFNYSYGDELYYDNESSLNYVDHLRDRVRNGRNGKGSFFVKASGNEFIVTDDYDNPNICVSHNANFPLENEYPFMIVVGAVNAHGEKSSYSNAGSNVWVSAPGGEFGVFEPAILTTDLPTCLKGLSNASSPLNSFEYGHNLNPSCLYTSTMNGTSAAAPMISGVIALLLDANPNLKWRDVKHILAVTARKIDLNTSAFPSGKNHPSTELSGCTNLSLFEHQYELGWVTNQAGISFNNFYGFGLVDVEEAIKLAKDFSLDPKGFLPMDDFTEINPDFDDPVYASNFLNLNIPDNDSTGVTDTLTITDNLTVETVQIKVQITHPRSGEIGIELTSPQGTKSILMNINNSFLLGDDEDLNIVLASHAFYGESSIGDWEIKIIDGSSINSEVGKLVNWKINILGH